MSPDPGMGALKVQLRALDDAQLDDLGLRTRADVEIAARRFDAADSYRDRLEVARLLRRFRRRLRAIEAETQRRAAVDPHAA